MRIALLNSANVWGGSGVSYAKLARELGHRGHVAHLVTAFPELTDRLREEGLDVTQIPSGNTGPRAVWALRRTLGSIDAQAVVVDTPRDVRLACYATLLHRARIVYRYNPGDRRPHTSLRDRAYLSRVAACVYQSRHIQAYAMGHAAWMALIPAYRIPNGYDTSRYAPRAEAGRAFREQYGIAAGARVAMTAAALTRDKGHGVAIEALGRVRQAGIDLVYVVCGDGPLEGELVSIARRCGLPAVFTGLLGAGDMIAAYNAADLVVHPSLREIFPNAVGEAMACARPVIAAAAGGTAELLGRDGVTGVLVPPADIGALADAVRLMFADARRRRAVGEAARQRIENEFPLSRMIDGYERALAEVLGTAG